MEGTNEAIRIARQAIQAVKRRLIRFISIWK